MGKLKDIDDVDEQRVLLSPLHLVREKLKLC